jgi:hypothetical protein
MDLALIIGIIHVIAQAIVNLTPSPAPESPLASTYRTIEILAGIITSKAKT